MRKPLSLALLLLWPAAAHCVLTRCWFTTGCFLTTECCSCVGARNCVLTVVFRRFASPSHSRCQNLLAPHSSTVACTLLTHPLAVV